MALSNLWQTLSKYCSTDSEEEWSEGVWVVKQVSDEISSLSHNLPLTLPKWTLIATKWFSAVCKSSCVQGMHLSYSKTDNKASRKGIAN